MDCFSCMENLINRRKRKWYMLISTDPFTFFIPKNWWSSSIMISYFIISICHKTSSYLTWTTEDKQRAVLICSWHEHTAQYEELCRATRGTQRTALFFLTLHKKLKASRYKERWLLALDPWWCLRLAITEWFAFGVKKQWHINKRRATDTQVAEISHTLPLPVLPPLLPSLSSLFSPPPTLPLSSSDWEPLTSLAVIT